MKQEGRYNQLNIWYMVSDWKQSAVVLVIKHKKDGETRKNDYMLVKVKPCIFVKTNHFNIYANTTMKSDSIS